VRSLRSASYDISIDLQGLMKSAAVVLLSRAPVRIGVHEQREGARLVSRGVPRSPGRLHVVEDNLRCAELLGASPTPVSFALPVRPEAVTSIAHTLSALRVSLEAPLIVINPSASVAWKTWPVQHWARVAGALSAAGTVVLVGGAEQRLKHAALARQAARPLHDLTGRTTLVELVALLDRCALHVAPDTGSAHIAAALGRPVVSVYGPTPPWRKAPYGYEDLVVDGGGCLPDAADAVIAQAQRVLAHAAPLRSETGAGAAGG
jgi:heptosyltransferase-1